MPGNMAYPHVRPMSIRDKYSHANVEYLLPLEISLRIKYLTSWLYHMVYAITIILSFTFTRLAFISK
ncbi:hypothetical protein KDA_73320 [Dictyobacter alpinus]|uniref:Uncharacterized protein n=1 Tax=Dictyobacter alpinus TaxID=2014873 RepID=A0A402BKF9_9CHLR|nr:hypothetical protein KDA_73320 [Dictyobacter alpinus]